LLIDEYEGEEQHGASSDEKQTFNDGLEFNAWQLAPAYPSFYGEIIGKDAPLSNITKPEHLDFIEINLRKAVYLTGFTHKKMSGYLLKTDKNEDGYLVKITDLDVALKFLGPGEKLLSVEEHYDYNPTFVKSVHQGKARSYTRMSLTRGIGARASKDLITVRQGQHKTLKEETQRRNWIGLKKPASDWSQAEYKK